MSHRQTIIGLYVKYQAVTPSQVETATDIRNDLRMDARDWNFLLMMLEEALGIEIPDAESEAWKTLADIEGSVARLTGDGINPHGSGPSPVGPREGVQ